MDVGLQDYTAEI